MVEGRHSAGADHADHAARSVESHSGNHLSLVELHKQNVQRVADQTTDHTAAGTVYGGKDHIEVSRISGYHDTYQEYGGTKKDRPLAGPDHVPGKWSEHQKEITDAIDKVVESGQIGKPIKDVKVVYEEYDGEKPDPKQAKPDFVVAKDGSVEVRSNPDRKTDDPVVIQVERDKGDVGAPPEEAQKAIDGLVKYLADNYMHKKPDGTVDGQVKDDQGLVSDFMQKQIAPKVQPGDLPPPAQHQTEAVSRWHGSGGGANGGSDGGVLTPRQQADVIPPRDVPRQTDESDRLAAMKDVVAGFAVHNDKDPYHYVENRGDQGNAVGRYGATADGITSFVNWLAGLSPEQIDELIRKGVLPKNIKDFMKQMESDEGKDFLKTLKQGKEPPSKEQIDKFFGKELQESAASYAVTKMAQATANPDGSPNMGKIALGMQLGHPPNDTDLKNPQYQKLMEAADKTYPVALQHVLDGTANIDLSDKAKSVATIAKADVGKQLWTQYAAATENGNLGCAASVSTALRQAGAVPQNFNELSVYGLDQHLQQQGWKAVDFGHRQPGDVIVAYRTSDPAGSAGGGAHTGIVGEGGATYSNSSSSGQWSYNAPSDWMPPNGGYVNTYVLRPPSSNA